MSAISSIMSATGAAPVQGIKPAAKPPEDKGFSKMMESMEQLDSSQHNSDAALQELASGGNTNIHGTVIAYEEADIAIRAAFTARDKVVAAYEQIMNMAI
jgi:flagellar hook-basal body complex protein FliE